MSQQIEALKLALEALQDYVDEYGPWSDNSGAQYVLRVGKEILAQPEQELTTTLEASVYAGLDKKNDKKTKVDHHGKQPEQEPVAKYSDIVSDGGLDPRNKFDTTPPQRTWVELTDEEILRELERVDPHAKRLPTGLKIFAHYLEAKLKEKNNG